MTTYAQAKGARGHYLTTKLLKKEGWSVWVKDHKQVTYRGKGSFEWQHTGSNDIFAIPDEKNPKKKKGGFDLLAVKTDPWTLDANPSAICKFYQIKKTKKNPITPALKRLIKECADYHLLPRSCCYIIWWPDGVGLKEGSPIIWRADEE